MSKRTGSKRRPLLYVYVSLSVTSVDLRRMLQTIAEGKTITGDLGGKASTKEYTAAIVAKL
jgi:hypothetical protein